LGCVKNDFNSNNLNFGSFGLVENLLNFDKKHLLESNKVQIFKKDFLFLGFSDEKPFKLDLFKKTQQLNEKKLKPRISLQDGHLVKS